jgi:peptidoglycan/LPS O-acetylase OafA/YrhL
MDAVSPRSKPAFEQNRLYSLDALRGLAAIGVAVFWHYIHFFPACLFCDRHAFPFYRTFQWFYDYGQLLVDFFFVLSGFVLMRAYATKIAEGRITFGEYAVRRFSRLYPLHFLTLCVVAGEVIWMNLSGRSFIYHDNDIFHFVLNALMLQSTWFDRTETFNGPSWSIATEVIAYVLFFATIARLKSRFLVNIAFLVFIYAGMAMLYQWSDTLIINSFTGRALFGFFVGCILYQLAPYVSAANKRASVAFQVIFIVLAIGLVLASRKFGFETLFGRFELVLPLVVYPSIILFVITNKVANAFFTLAPFRVLGDSSYSIYLWHYPLQTVLYFSFVYFGLAPQRPLALIIYCVTVLAVSIASHYCFERPVQDRIRAWYSRPAKQPGFALLGEFEQPVA